MDSAAFEQEGAVLSAAVLSGMRDWRAQHPQATLREIKAELDTRLAGMQARLLENLALQSRATTWSREAATEPPRYPTCGEALQPRGRQVRHLKTHGRQELRLARTYGVCPQCGRGHFPPR